MSSRRKPEWSGGTLEGGARVVWGGDLPSGSGRLRFELGAGDELPLLWPGSEGYGPGATSPEELAAAAHAACFTMTLANGLARRGTPPARIVTDAHATFGVAGGLRRITRSELRIEVDAADLTEAELAESVAAAGSSCPVSNTLRAAGVELAVRSRLPHRERERSR
jgi:osmotically inducible protein OsmC